MENTQVTFEVVSNLKYVADLQAAKLITREGVSTKTGQPYKITAWETPLTFCGIEVGKLTAKDQLPYPKYVDGKYKAIKAYEWESYLSTKNKFISVREEDIKKDGFVLFYEEDQKNEQGNINHVRAYGRSIDGAYVQLWLYTNKADKTDPSAVRAQIKLKVTTYEEK